MLSTVPAAGLVPGAISLPPVFAGMDRGDAIAFFSRLLDAAQAGAPTWSDTELVESWLACCSRSGSAETVSTYRREIGHLLAWIAEHRPGLSLRLLDPAAAQAYVEHLRHLVAAGQLAARTFNKRTSAAKSLYGFAADPTRAAVSGVPRSPFPRRCLLDVPKLARPIAESDLDRLLAEIMVAARAGDRQAPRDFVLVKVAYRLGCRVSELAGLRWRDVVRQPDGAGLVHLLGKGNRARAVAISADTLALVESLPGGRGEPAAFLFPARSGSGHLSRQAIHGAVSRWGKLAGVPAWPHALRHSHATHAARRGADLHLVGRTLGHASPATTLGYVAADPSTSSSLLLG
jgi:site-specific recombinase XerD